MGQLAVRWVASLIGRILRRFTGIEFALVHAEPPSLFIIHKRDRLSPDEGEL